MRLPFYKTIQKGKSRSKIQRNKNIRSLEQSPYSYQLDITKAQPAKLTEEGKEDKQKDGCLPVTESVLQPGIHNKKDHGSIRQIAGLSITLTHAD